MCDLESDTCLTAPALARISASFHLCNKRARLAWPREQRGTNPLGLLPCTLKKPSFLAHILGDSARQSQCSEQGPRGVCWNLNACLHSLHSLRRCLNPFKHPDLWCSEVQAASDSFSLWWEASKRPAARSREKQLKWEAVEFYESQKCSCIFIQSCHWDAFPRKRRERGKQISTCHWMLTMEFCLVTVTDARKAKSQGEVANTHLFLTCSTGSPAQRPKGDSQFKSYPEDCEQLRWFSRRRAVHSNLSQNDGGLHQLNARTSRSWGGSLGVFVMWQTQTGVHSLQEERDGSGLGAGDMPRTWGRKRAPLHKVCR